MQDKEKDFTLYSNLLIQCYGIEVCGTMWIPNTIVRQSMGKNYDHNNKKKIWLFTLLTLAPIMQKQL